MPSISISSASVLAIESAGVESVVSRAVRRAFRPWAIGYEYEVLQLMNGCLELSLLQIHDSSCHVNTKISEEAKNSKSLTTERACSGVLHRGMSP